MPIRDLTRQGAYANPIGGLGGAAAAPASSASPTFLAKGPTVASRTAPYSSGYSSGKLPSAPAVAGASENFQNPFVTAPTIPTRPQAISTPLQDMGRLPTGYVDPQAIADPFRPTSSPMPTNYPDVFAGNSGRLPQPAEPPAGTPGSVYVPGGPRVTITSSPPQQITGTGWQDTIRNPGVVPGANDPHWADVLSGPAPRPNQVIDGTGWQDTIRNPGVVPGANDPHWADVFGVTPTAAPTPFSMAQNPGASRNNSNPTYSTGGTG